MQGKIPISFSASFPQGSTGGEAAHTLTTQEIPAHTHAVTASSNVADQGSPQGNYWAVETANTYAATPDSTMAGPAISTAGSGQPHNNMPPYLVINYCIALVGVFSLAQLAHHRHV